MMANTQSSPVDSLVAISETVAGFDGLSLMVKQDSGTMLQKVFTLHPAALLKLVCMQDHYVSTPVVKVSQALDVLGDDRICMCYPN
jgi:hypothetical protein